MGSLKCVILSLLVLVYLSSVYAQDRIWSCNFEEADSCGAILLAVGDFVKFDLNNGPTPSDDTGPAYDNTLKTPKGLYIYLEATGREEGNQAIMESPKLPTGQVKCLEFYYHMYSGSGDHQGTLRVEALPMDVIVFNVSGNQGNQWNLVRKDIDRDVNQLIFRAIRGVRYQSDIALDDIFITSGSCKVGGAQQPGQESFPGGQSPSPGKTPTSDPQGPDIRPPSVTPGPPEPGRRPGIDTPLPDRRRTTSSPMQPAPTRRPGFDPPPRPDPQGPNKPGTPPPIAEQRPGIDPPLQADLPQIPDGEQRPDPPSPPPFNPRTTGPPSLPLDPRFEPFEVRLVKGKDTLQGRLEVLVNNEWGTVCSDGWTDMESFAACRSLNLSAGELGSAPEAARLLSSDETPIWLDGVRCSPGSHLDECCRNEFGVQDCDHSQDVYLNCGAPITVTTATPCRPGSTDCRPPPCNPRLQICLPSPPRAPDPPGVAEGPSTVNFGQRISTTLPPRPAPPPVVNVLPARAVAKSDFNEGSQFNNGLNFTNDGNFVNMFKLFEEVESNGTAPGKFWMEMHSDGGGGYARLISNPVKLPFNTDGCLGYRILTAARTQWSTTVGNRIGRQLTRIGSGESRETPELIYSPIKSSPITNEEFNIYFEAWVVTEMDLFAVDDITFFDGPCPPA